MRKVAGNTEHPKRDQKVGLTLKRYDDHPCPLDMGVSRPPRVGQSNVVLKLKLQLGFLCFLQ